MSAPTLDQLIEQIKALGLDPATEYTALPPHVRDMLLEYQKAQGVSLTDSGQESLWNQVTTTITGAANKKATDAAVGAASTTGVVTPSQKTVLDKTGADTTGLVVSNTDSPRWVLEQFGGDPTSEQQRRITDEWNTVFGTTYTYQQLTILPQFQDPTDTVQKVVQGAQLAIEPQVEYSVTLPGNRSYKVSGDQQKAQFGQYGYDNKDIVKLVRWADTFGLKDEMGDPAWQPLAALLRATGLDLASPAPSQQRVGTEPDLTVDHGHGRGPAPTGRKVSDYQDFAMPGPEISVALISQAYKQNLSKYGDPSLAYLATLDSSLADRIVSTGGDVTKLTETDFHLIDSRLTAGAWSPQALHAMNYAGGSGWEDFFSRMNQRTNAAEAAAGATRVAPDPDAVKQAVKDLWRKWFRAEPTDNLVNEMAGNIMATAAAAPKDQNVDVEAQLRKMAEGSPDYQTLYGNKQPGQTEMDYQAQFTAGAQDMIGNQAPDNGTILAGMRSGNYNTTIGATAGAGSSWGNSRFLGRLAAAGQLVNSAT